MNELTEGGQLNAALTRRYGIPGQHPPAGVLASEVFPTIAVDSRMDPDVLFLAQVRLCAGFIAASAPGAGLRQIVGLQNPTTSGIVATLESVTCLGVQGGVAPQSFILALSDTFTSGPDATKDGSHRDSRWPFDRVPSCQMFRIESEALIGTGIEFQAWDINSADGTNNIVFEAPPIIIGPGSQITVFPGADDLGVTCSFKWTERRLTAWESAP